MTSCGSPDFFDADVIVAGGGPAGVATAVNAARGGKKVRLLELQQRDWVYEPEYMKFVCEEMCREAGVKVTLQCPVVAAYRDASGRNIETVVTESMSGRRAYRAKTFVDCTGDGDLAALSGCGFDYGYPGLAYGLPATMNALVAVDDADAISEATMHSRREIIALAAALEKLGGPWKGFRVIGTAEQIGHRDARRIHGLYTVTKEEIESGRKFDDCATVSRTSIDIHGLDKKMNDVKAAGGSGGVKFQPFQIPLRCCRAKDADNLWMAGRNISGDFYTQASYRVTGSSVALGEAVGRAIAY